MKEYFNYDLGNENDASFGPDRSKNRSKNPFHGFIPTHEDNETGIAKEQVSKLTVKVCCEDFCEEAGT